MGPSREACDRCHSMKTRCVRAPHSHACVRCTRLGFSCHYSPPGRTGRPVGSKKKVTSPHQRRSSKTSSSKHSPNLPFMPTSIPECDPSLLDLSFPDEPMFFNMDGLLPDLNDPFAGTTVVGSPASNAASHNNLFLEDQLGMPLKPPMLPEPTVEVDGLLNRLLAIQTRLAKILNCLSGPSNNSDDIEGIYRLSEDVISILTSNQGTQPTGVSMLLLSSCYVSLIQAFECIANALRQSLHNPDQGLGFEKFRRLSQAVMPYISVGAVRLDMPRTAITEVSLHIIGQIVQRLKASMSECAMRMNIGHNQEEWMSPVGDLTDLAMNEVRQREDSLFMHLQTAN